ncbi:MAG: peptidylprolyl isomerase, partial [Pseudomonadota bacterium]
MADNTNQENQTETTTSADEVKTKPGDSRVATFVLMGVVVVMAIATVGYIAVNAINVTNAQGSTQTTEAPSEDNPVVARVEGREFRAEDIQDFMATLPAQVQQIPLQFIYPSLINQFANLQLATDEAYRQGLDTDEEVVAIMQRRQDEIVRDVLLERVVEERVTEEAIEDAYNEFLLSNASEPEVKARHILVDTVEEAEAVIVALDGGADFAELAEEKSTGPSSVNGGDLGFFTRDRMVPPFA